MKLLNKTSYMAMAATAVIAFSLTTNSAQAQETVSSTATVVVQNAFTLTEVSGLDFGTIVALRDGAGGGAVSNIVVGAEAANATTVTNAGGANDDRIIELTAGDRAEYAISAALPSTTFSIILPSTPVALNCAACSGAQEDFTVNSFVDDGADGTVTTDGTGAASFFVGAQLDTVSGTATYEDGTYSGTYDVTVTF
jgi:spore coat protein U-like protein